MMANLVLAISAQALLFHVILAPRFTVRGPPNCRLLLVISKKRPPGSVEDLRGGRSRRAPPYGPKFL